MSKKVQNVLIVVPPVRPSQPPTRFPLGLAYVAASLERHGVVVTVLDLNILRLTHEQEETALKLALKTADIVCTGGMVTMLSSIERIVWLVRKYNPVIPLLVGGPLASHNQELILDKIPIDILVRGEGEDVVCRIVDVLPDLKKLYKIPGLVFRSAGEIVFTGEPQRIQELDPLPFPAYHLFSYDKYIMNRGNPRSTDIITGRGCPYRCSFCYQNFGNIVKFRSVDNVMEEIRYLVATYEVAHFYLEDEFFIQRGEYVREFCRQIRDVGVTWAASTRANTLSLELLKELRASGCTMLMIGIESFDEEMLVEMNKQVAVQTIEQVCQWMTEVGIEISPGLIIGMPGESHESVRRTVEGCIRNQLPICEWTYAFATPYPGTRLYDDARNRGLIVDEWDYLRKLSEVGDTRDLALNLTRFADKELVALRDEAIVQVSDALKKRRPLIRQVASFTSRVRSTVSSRLSNASGFRNICKDHFRNDLSHEDQKRLFKTTVGMVEIETFSYCNRKCWFCSNTIVDRSSFNAYLPVDIYNRIIADLAEIGFCKTVSFSRYNEPLADEVIFARLGQARRKLPMATLHLNTNGDFLDIDYLYSLYVAGLRSLNLQVYISQWENDEATLAQVEKRITELGLTPHPSRVVPGEWLERRADFLDMSVRVYARNFAKNGSDRGGVLNRLSSETVRRSPCFQPFFNLYVDYNGNVVPCCNLRSDLPEHAGYVVGNLQENENDIFTLFGSAKMVAWRRGLTKFGPKSIPCGSCSFDIVESTILNVLTSKSVSTR